MNAVACDTLCYLPDVSPLSQQITGFGNNSGIEVFLKEENRSSTGGGGGGGIADLTNLILKVLICCQSAYLYQLNFLNLFLSTFTLTELC